MVIKVVSKNRRTHLIAVVRGTGIVSTGFSMCPDLVSAVPEAEGRPEFESPWFVFNDFVVHNISESEALSFTGKWKVVFFSWTLLLSVDSTTSQVPTILYLERLGAREALDFSGLPDAIDPSILSRDTSISLYVPALLELLEYIHVLICSIETAILHSSSMKSYVPTNFPSRELWSPLTLNSWKCKL